LAFVLADGAKEGGYSGEESRFVVIGCEEYKIAKDSDIEESGWGRV
jgi:hypothetical protein